MQMNARKNFHCKREKNVDGENQNKNFEREITV